MTLKAQEFAVAHAMVALTDGTAKMPLEAFQQFMCYWSAFNNIYATLAEQNGKVPELKRDRQGNIEMRPTAGMQIPKVDPVSERNQIDIAFSRFSSELKHLLVVHPSTKFFACRTPRWRGKKIEFDVRSQRLNGVLNVGYTTSVDDPVWSPIDTQAYEQYQGSPDDEMLREQLAKQVLDLVYTVRNNTFHGGKRADDANDREVIDKALPLLRKIVYFFLYDER